jgi:hypothetical protein
MAATATPAELQPREFPLLTRPPPHSTNPHYYPNVLILDSSYQQLSVANQVTLQWSEPNRQICCQTSKFAVKHKKLVISTVKPRAPTARPRSQQAIESGSAGWGLGGCRSRGRRACYRVALLRVGRGHWSPASPNDFFFLLRIFF